MDSAPARSARAGAAATDALAEPNRGALRLKRAAAPGQGYIS